MVKFLLFILIWFFIALFTLKEKPNKLSNKIILISMNATYIISVLYLTLLNRTIGTIGNYNLELFWSYNDLLTLPGNQHLQYIVFNIIMFVPFGFLPLLLFNRLNSFHIIIPAAFIVSFFIELLQRIFKLGFFEFDDVFNNTLGAVIGYGVYYALDSLVYNKRLKGFVIGLLPLIAVSTFFVAIFFVKN